MMIATSHRVPARIVQSTDGIGYVFGYAAARYAGFSQRQSFETRGSFVGTSSERVH
jgi:hypothetical protein